MGGFLLPATLVLAVYVFAHVAAARRAEASAEKARGHWRDLITRDPRNVAAHEALGDSLRASSRLTEACAAYRQALEISGDRLGNDPLHYKVRRIERALRERDRGKPNIDHELLLCPQCGAVNPPYVRACETCTAMLPYATFSEALRDKELLRATAEAATCALVLIAALWAFSAQPLDIKGVLLISTVIVAAWRFLQAVGPRRL